MALEPAILIYTKAQVTSVNNRVYALKAPQGVTEPYIVFMVISKNFVNSMPIDSGLTETRVQFDVFGTTYSSVKAVVESLKSTYRNYNQGQNLEALYMGGKEWVQATLLDNEIDFYEEDTGRYHTSLDIIFWHVEG